MGPSLFFSLLVVTVAFLPIFTLQAQAGRLFTPLAYTKTFSMLFSSFLAITLTPMLMTIFIRGKIRSEENNPISRFLHWIYEPVVGFALRFKMFVIVAGVVIVAFTVIPFMKLGTEFMPPLYEGTLFYMPVTAPAASVTVATDTPPTAEQNPETDSRGGICFWKGRKSRNSNRSGSPRDV